METKSLKALAIKVLQGNKQGNSKETHCVWIDGKVSDCQEPCLECPHYKTWWSERVQWLETNRPDLLPKSYKQKENL